MLFKLKNYLEFVQFKHTIFALPFALSSYILVSNKIGFDLIDLTLIMIALINARIFGMSINRILDVNIDKSIKHLNWFPKIKLEKGLKMIVDNEWI